MPRKCKRKASTINRKPKIDVQENEKEEEEEDEEEREEETRMSGMGPDLEDVKPIQRRTNSIQVIYKGRKYVIPPIFQMANKRGECGRLINDTIVELYLCHYLVNEKYDNAMRSRCRVFNSFFYASLRMRLRQNVKERPRRSELSEIYRKIFLKKLDSEVLEKEILVLPIHIDKPKHWFLAIIHNVRGAIRRPVVVQNDENEDESDPNRLFRVKETDFEDRPECRIIIMDSLCLWDKYKACLKVHHTRVIETLRLWLQMTAAAAGEELMGARVRSAVCEKLPRQLNSVDCGLYMMAYAEYFTYYNTQWTNMPTDSLVYLRMDPTAEALLATDDPRLRLEALLTDMNKKLFETKE